MNTVSIASINTSLRTAALDILAGEGGPQAQRILREARPRVESLRSNDPKTYYFVKKAIIETMKRNVRSPRLMAA